MKKYIILTGGSGDIGSEVIKFLIKKDYKVINLDKKSNIISKDENVINIDCDLYNISEIFLCFNKIKKITKNIFGLVNCAGITQPGETLSYKLKDWQKTLGVNLTAPFLVSQLTAKIMIKNKIQGSIVNITSISAEVAMPNSAAYNASKAGLKSLTKSLALDFGQYLIRVNNLSPGYTKTKMTQKSWTDLKLRKVRTEKTILKKWAKPNDYNEAILFLLDNSRSGYMTGADIIMDGGWLSKGL
jgi:NAD(P)-dependent dehydrogenase (short-subunit alcohol dehydrogenase family)